MSAQGLRLIAPADSTYAIATADSTYFSYYTY